MAHKEQFSYCEKILRRFPHLFVGKSVLDVGSLDINGNNRWIFTDCEYVGIDLGEGDNVDVVCRAKDYEWGPFDVVISTEMLEHDRDAEESVKRMVDLVKPGGVLLITCAWPGRPEHGTSRTSPYDAPFTNDYYRNVPHDELEGWISSRAEWEVAEADQCGTDTRFFGIKSLAIPK